jgi:hypothetical protein
LAKDDWNKKETTQAVGGWDEGNHPYPFQVFFFSRQRPAVAIL